MKNEITESRKKKRKNLVQLIKSLLPGVTIITMMSFSNFDKQMSLISFISI